ncbi:MAG: hypothetical protein ACYDER_03740 [Ktedonobacteraceae bacterium]
MKGTYKSALLLVAVVAPIPVLATFITAILYIILEQQFTSPPAWLSYGVLLIGLGVTLIIWLFAALFCRGRATAKGANKLSYDAIIQELQRLEVNYDTINEAEPDENDEDVKVAEADRPEPPNNNASALQRAYYALYGEYEDEYIENILKVNGAQWVQASGYISIWNRLQAADAEMISLLPIETVSGEADYDLSRLNDSTIPDNQQWIDRINTAKATLGKINQQIKPQKPEENSAPQTAHEQSQPLQVNAIRDDEEQKRLEQALVDLLKFSLTSPTLPMDDAHIPKSFGPAFLAIIKNAVTAPTPQPQQTEEQARADLRQARISINSYISNRWVGLIQSRNLLIEISFYTSIFIYALFILAIIDNAPPSAIFAALVFFIVGAVAGLFPRLAPKTRVTSQSARITTQLAKKNSQPTTPNSQSSAANGQAKTTNQPADQSDKQNASTNMKPLSDDYGLTRARILITPVFSGLAALIGVVLASMLSITLVALTPGPSNIGTPAPVAIVATVTATTSAPTAPQGNRSIPNYPSLDEIYSLTNNVQGVIFALVFGFLPSLVINALQREAADLQCQLQSTDPGEQASTQQ